MSVVMPAYNHERYVGAAVESVLNQTHANLELIVIDDGSTDRTAEVVQAYPDPRIRYFHQENQDAFNALNRGMSLSEGSFISIINSDDVYHLERLERLVALQRETGAQCIFTDVTPVDDEGVPFADPGHPWCVWHERNRQYYLKSGDLYNGFLHGNSMVTTSNLFMTKTLQESVGGFAPIRYLHDYDYIFRILLAAEDDTLYLHDEKLLSYRIHGANTLSEAAITGREQDRQLIRKYLLARCPPETHANVNTAIDRLIALELELIEVRAVLDSQTRMAAPEPPGILSRVRRKLGSVLGRGAA
ncbi:glycosyltransferase family 2 protein [Pseudomonadota bacterium]